MLNFFELILEIVYLLFAIGVPAYFLFKIDPWGALRSENIGNGLKALLSVWTFWGPIFSIYNGCAGIDRAVLYAPIMVLAGFLTIVAITKMWKIARDA